MPSQVFRITMLNSCIAMWYTQGMDTQRETMKKMIVVRLTEPEQAQMRQAAKQEEMPISSWVRRLIRRSLAQTGRNGQ